MTRKLFFVALLSVFFSVSASAQGTGAATAAPDKPATSAVFRPTQDQIKQVQGILKTKGIYSGDATGTYNDETRAAIKSFQEGSGLRETGTLNRATLEKFGVELTESQKLIPVSESSYASSESDKPAKSDKSTKMETAASASGDDKPKRPAPFRATKEQVIDAQKLLKTRSLYSGEETGKLDDATRDGLKKFQEASSIKVTGTLNAITLEKMGIALTESQKASAAAQAPKN